MSGFPLDEPQTWIVTALALGALLALARGALPRRGGGSGCGGCDAGPQRDRRD